MIYALYNTFTAFFAYRILYDLKNYEKTIIEKARQDERDRIINKIWKFSLGKTQMRYFQLKDLEKELKSKND